MLKEKHKGKGKKNWERQLERYKSRLEGEKILAERRKGKRKD